VDVWGNSRYVSGLWATEGTGASEKKVLRRPYSGLPVPERDLQESWGGTFYKGM